MGVQSPDTAEPGDLPGMCGVFGYVTDRDEALGPILIEAAQRLTYRGYDSVGAATFRDGTIDLRKDVGKVDAVAARYNFAEMRGSAASRSCAGRPSASRRRSTRSRISIRTATWSARTTATWSTTSSCATSSSPRA